MVNFGQLQLTKNAFILRLLGTMLLEARTIIGTKALYDWFAECDHIVFISSWWIRISHACNNGQFFQDVVL